LNVVVLIPRTLQPACEGKGRVDLGVPPTSSVGDVLQALMALYPGLRAFVANEKRPLKQHFNVQQHGSTVYLFTSTSSSGREQGRRV
jgi:hypothetical protein